MKVLLIHPYLNGRGGSQRYAVEILNRFKSERDIEVELFSYYYNPKSCYPDILDISDVNAFFVEDSANVVMESTMLSDFKVQFVSCLKRFRVIDLFIYFGLDYLYSFFNTFRNALRLTNFIETTAKINDFDVIFCLEEPLSIYSASLLSQKYKKPLVWFCFDSIEKWYIDWSKYNNHILRSFLLRRLYFSFDKYLIKKSVNSIIVLDSRMQFRVKKLYDIEASIIRGGLPLSVIKKGNKRKLTKSVGEKIILNIGIVSRFARARRLEDFLLVARRLITEDAWFNFYLNCPVTDHRYYNELMSDYHDVFQSKNVYLDVTPFATDDELHNFYSKTDIFIFPNMYQTWGHAALEAMCFGCYTLVSNGCGISEVMLEDTVTVFKGGDIDDLYTKIKNIDLDNFSRIAKIQQAHVMETFDWEVICKQYINLFKELCVES